MTWEPSLKYMFVNNEEKLLVGIILYMAKEKSTKIRIGNAFVCSGINLYLMRQFFSVFTLWFFVMMLLLFLNIKSPFGISKIARFLGSISFTWYLVHQNIGYSLLYHFCPEGQVEYFWLTMPSLITLVLALCIDWLSKRIGSLILLKGL